MSGYAYKVLNEDGTAFHGGRGSWPLPNGKPGQWLTVKDRPLVPCKNGLHLCRRQDLVRWLGPSIWIAEYDGEVVVADDKIVVGRARLLERVSAWNETNARLFAADCAERVLHLVPESRREPFAAAIRAARQFARGEIGEDAWIAAWAVARDAAGDAVGGAARAAAVRAAARAAAWAAAWAATRAAARAAAGDAVGAAAWAAARAAAGDAQTETLFRYLPELPHQGDANPVPPRDAR